jgi:hypothetical protein
MCNAVLLAVLCPEFDIPLSVLQDVVCFTDRLVYTISKYSDLCPHPYSLDLISDKKQLEIASYRIKQQMLLIHYVSNPAEETFNFFKASRAVDQIIAGHWGQSQRYEFVSPEAKLYHLIEGVQDKVDRENT